MGKNVARMTAENPPFIALFKDLFCISDKGVSSKTYAIHPLILFCSGNPANKSNRKGINIAFAALISGFKKRKKAGPTKNASTIATTITKHPTRIAFFAVAENCKARRTFFPCKKKRVTNTVVAIIEITFSAPNERRMACAVSDNSLDPSPANIPSLTSAICCKPSKKIGKQTKGNAATRKTAARR